MATNMKRKEYIFSSIRQLADHIEGTDATYFIKKSDAHYAAWLV
jgi:hypothetical protein